MEVAVDGVFYTEEHLKGLPLFNSVNASIALVDGDVCCYQMAARCEDTSWAVIDAADDKEIAVFKYKSEAMKKQKEHPDEWEVIKHKQVRPRKEMLANVRYFLEKEIIPEIPNSATIFFFLTPGKTFRHGLNPEYKAHRKQEVVPFYVPFLRDRLISIALGDELDNTGVYLKKMFAKIGIKLAVVPFAEADDGICVFSNLAANKDGVTILSNDKDLLQCGVDVRDWTKHVNYRLTEEERHYYLAQQCLAGDTTDNIKGIHLVGEKRAQKMLDALDPEVFRSWPTTYEAVRELYLTHPSFDSPEEAEQTFVSTYRMVKLLDSLNEINDVQIEPQSTTTEGC